MKKTILLSGLALVAAQTAHAQSGEDKSFDGFKVGASVGRTSQDVDRKIAGETAKLDIDKKSIDWRGYVGYDIQTDSNIVIGAEVGIGGGGKTLEQKVGATNVKVNPRRSIDATGRVGYAAGNQVLLFAKGGWAWQRFDVDAKSTAAGAKSVETRIKENGFLYGAGVEYALSPSFSLRGEFDRVKFSDELKRNRFLLGAAVRF